MPLTILSRFFRAAVYLLALIGSILTSALPAMAQQSAPVKFERDGLKLELAALPPDTVRAFFLGRGFSKKDADHLVATGCVFRSAIGSAYVKPGRPLVTVDLKSWQLFPGAGKPATSPKLREDWQPIWQARNVGEDAKIAFYWALFPTKQTFAAGDYNWGMLTFGLPAGTRFSLKLVWQSGDTTHETMLKDLTCGK